MHVSMYILKILGLSGDPGHTFLPIYEWLAVIPLGRNAY